jgi:hypothetical protein
MTGEIPFWIFFVGPFVWIVFGFAASAIYRRRVGKPIMPRPPVDAAFEESGCSGRSLANVLTRIGGASRCLLVYVQNGELVVTPTFPFTLLFLPEVYGLEFRAPITDVSAQVTGGLFGKVVLIESRSRNRPSMELRLQGVDGLLSALKGSPRPANQADKQGVQRPRRRFQTIFTAGFLFLWAALALSFGTVGLYTDFDFRSHGLATQGVVVGNNVAGGRGGSAIVRYTVEGRDYSLTSIRGSGLYKIGDREGLRYIANAPEAAREDDYLSFDLIWMVAGLIALTVGSVMIAWPRLPWSRQM